MGSLLRLATAGSVDDGKSTLVGRLLYDSKSVLADQLAAVERVSESRGLDRADLALLTDGLRAEREQGITIDVAYRYFATGKRDFVLADCPGHVQYTRNTVTGASTADVVVILVDARHGVVEQTRRHLAVAALLRVPHVALAVNKIDLIDFDEAQISTIAAEVAELARTLGVADVQTFPLCSVDGDNVVTRSVRTPWYTGPTLLEWLETVPLRQERTDLRFPVQLVLRPQSADFPDYRGYAGRVESGSVSVGDEVVVLPSGAHTRVVGVDTADGPLHEAGIGRSVTLLLADNLDISRGDLIAAAQLPPAASQDLHGTICWLADDTLTARSRVLLKHGTRTVTAMVTAVEGVLDLDTLDLVPATHLGLNDIGRVRLRLAQPIAVDDYSDNRRTGSFLLIDAHDGRTLAAGMTGLSTATHTEPLPGIVNGSAAR